MEPQKRRPKPELCEFVRRARVVSLGSLSAAAVHTHGYAAVARSVSLRRRAARLCSSSQPTVADSPTTRQIFGMASPTIPVDTLSAEERIALMGRLWDSLDPAAAAPITPALAAELDRREADADTDPSAGTSWADVKRELERKLR